MLESPQQTTSIRSLCDLCATAHRRLLSLFPSHRPSQQGAHKGRRPCSLFVYPHTRSVQQRLFLFMKIDLLTTEIFCATIHLTQSSLLQVPVAGDQGSCLEAWGRPCLICKKKVPPPKVFCSWYFETFTYSRPSSFLVFFLRIPWCPNQFPDSKSIRRNIRKKVLSRKRKQTKICTFHANNFEETPFQPLLFLIALARCLPNTR